MFGELRIYLVGIVTAWFFTWYFYWRTNRNFIPFDELLIHHLMAIRTQSGDLHGEIVNQVASNSSLQKLSGGLNHSIGELVLLLAEHLKRKYPNWKPTRAMQEIIDTHSGKP